MKTYQEIAFAAALAGAASCAQAQLAVTVIGDMTATVNQSANIAQYIKQVATLEQQYQQLQKTYSAIMGSRNMSTLLQNPALYSYLPTNVATAIKANGSGVTGAAALTADLKLFDITQSSINPNSATAKNFTTRQSGNANYQVINDQAYAAATDRVAQLNAMTQSIDGATDPMAIAALHTRIVAEQGLIANEQTKLAVLTQMAANDDRIREQQAKEIIMKATRTSGGLPDGW